MFLDSGIVFFSGQTDHAEHNGVCSLWKYRAEYCAPFAHVGPTWVNQRSILSRGTKQRGSLALLCGAKEDYLEFLLMLSRQFLRVSYLSLPSTRGYPLISLSPTCARANLSCGLHSGFENPSMMLSRHRMASFSLQQPPPPLSLNPSLPAPLPPSLALRFHPSLSVNAFPGCEARSAR
jgi:hypothetical protein